MCSQYDLVTPWTHSSLQCIVTMLLELCDGRNRADRMTMRPGQLASVSLRRLRSTTLTPTLPASATNWTQRRLLLKSTPYKQQIAVDDTYSWLKLLQHSYVKRTDQWSQFNKYVGPAYCRAEMYAGCVVCCPPAESRYLPMSQTDRRTPDRYTTLSARGNQRSKTTTTFSC